jgi:uncharacterized protein (TIGR00299 family) protein
MSRVLYLDLFSGASGDMLLGALVDAGLSADDLRADLGQLDLAGYELQVERVVRRGISGVQVTVQATAEDYPARHLPDVQRLIGQSGLSARVRATALAVFERLARVEARIHGVAVDQVHFHEIGAVDSLVDIVGFVAGLERLEVEGVFASGVPTGSGTVETAHGTLPLPAPATLALLAEVGAPLCPHPAQAELVTPTAAALLAELAVFAMPPMTIQAVGYGFGQKEFPWANVVRAWLGQAQEPLGAGRDQVVQIECNLDDERGETLGYVMEQLLAAGALDVWFTPAQMKKNRPGVVLAALAHAPQVDALVQLILRETTTLGLRMTPLERVVAGRQVRQVETPWGAVRVKEKLLGGEVVAASPEYEDCARLAREHKVPLQQVVQAAREAAHG